MLSVPGIPRLRSVCVCLLALAILLSLLALRRKGRVRGHPPSYYFGDQGICDLCHAISRDEVKEATRLIGGGVDAGSRGKHGMTPLCWALAHRSQETYRLLLESGADPNARTWGIPLVSWAARLEASEFLSLALQYGGDANATAAETGATPIFEASDFRRIPNVRLLIAAGANLNSQDSMGETPMTSAAALNFYDIVYILLEAGADPEVTGNTGASLAWAIHTSLETMDRSSPLYGWLQRVVALLGQRGLVVSEKTGEFASLGDQVIEEEPTGAGTKRE